MAESEDISSPLSSHLEELRAYLLLPFIINAIIMIMIISFSSNIITHILEAVSLKVNDLSTYTPVEFFKTKILLSLILSLIFCSPLWLLSIYSFSRTGLTEYEKNNVRYSFIIGQTFFLLGCAAGFSLVTPYFLDLLLADSEI
ncbi:MAG: twin-arginine translocase subunit TatC, partial [Candidatus Thermoplasmatota archaeon]|nr:twin-arginine translocase subunit TatC [Candidatus Thermoplasmatota archaeon]